MYYIDDTTLSIDKFSNSELTVHVNGYKSGNMVTVATKIHEPIIEQWFDVNDRNNIKYIISDTDEYQHPVYIVLDNTNQLTFIDNEDDEDLPCKCDIELSGINIKYKFSCNSILTTPISDIPGLYERLKKNEYRTTYWPK
uniref:Uncharacterized protein n=1 Tax=viral metagenome TaxID=1070528 RepID=A0A6C0J695_9ZZZZ